ncbi:MAG: ATP-binding cassette domain-containing protein [Azospirillaceae bacterium]
MIAAERHPAGAETPARPHAEPEAARPMLAAEGLSVRIPLGRGRGTVSAVENVSLTLAAGGALGLVGESGSGKTTVARAVLGLTAPTEGRIAFDGRDIAGLDRAGMRDFRRRAQMVFQDPYSSLDPRMSVARLIAEPLDIHRVGTRAERRARVLDLLDLVGLPRDFAGRVPQQLSGGQRQRVGIARALALDPEVLVCDEAVSALDVSVQAQILNLLRDLQRRLGIATLFISHDMAVIRFVARMIAVMYLGRVVETGPTRAILDDPRHPYTMTLLSAVPVADPRRRRRPIVLSGELPSAVDPPSGCRFRTRCPLAAPRCAEAVPPLRPMGAEGRRVACHFAEEAPGLMARHVEETTP